MVCDFKAIEESIQTNLQIFKNDMKNVKELLKVKQKLLEDLKKEEDKEVDGFNMR